jgi:hypothetical protein
VYFLAAYNIGANLLVPDDGRTCIVAGTFYGENCGHFFKLKIKNEELKMLWLG